eukprot:Gb_12478 [translate_table: standard]
MNMSSYIKELESCLKPVHSEGNLELRVKMKVVGQIRRVDGRQVTYGEFKKKYMMGNEPVLLTGLMDQWSACQDWVTDNGQPNLSFFSDHFGSSQVQVRLPFYLISNSAFTAVSASSWSDFTLNSIGTLFDPDQTCNSHHTRTLVGSALTTEGLSGIGNDLSLLIALSSVLKANPKLPLNLTSTAAYAKKNSMRNSVALVQVLNAPISQMGTSPGGCGFLCPNNSNLMELVTL